MVQPGRKFGGGNGYRYGFNGKENDKDISEGGQDYGMRIYDARVGKFLSVDPLGANFPMLTPYQFASNTPIWAIDLDGLEAKIISSTISNNNLLCEFFDDHLLTRGGKEFDKALSNQQEFNVLYTTFHRRDESMVVITNNGNLAQGESGNTQIFGISSLEQLHFYRDDQKMPALQDIKDEDVINSFNDHKKIVVIAISDEYGSARTNEIIAKNPKAKRNINLNASHAFNHEETAHALDILKHISKTEAQEHIDYQDRLPDGMDNSFSPDITQLKRQTKAGKNVEELKKIIDAKNNKLKESKPIKSNAPRKNHT